MSPGPLAFATILGLRLYFQRYEAPPAFWMGAIPASLAYFAPQLAIEAALRLRPEAITAIVLSSTLIRLLALALSIALAWKIESQDAAPQAALAFVAVALAAMLFTVVTMFAAPIHGAGPEPSGDA